MDTADFSNTLVLAWDTTAAGNTLSLAGRDTNVWVGVRLGESAGYTGDVQWAMAAADNRRPVALLLSAAANPTRQSPIPVTAAFDEDVAGFGPAQVGVANGAAGGFSALSARTYTFQVTPSGQGLVQVALAEGEAGASAWAGPESGWRRGLALGFSSNYVSDLAVFDQNTGAWYVRTVAGGILVWADPWGWPGAEPVEAP